MSSLQRKSISGIGAIVSIASIVSTLAVAQSQTLPPATIADNDSIYIDGKTFAITPGRAKGDTSAQIEALGAEKTTRDGLTARDAAVGQFFWLTTHEVGHAMFDIFKVPLFGHAEDAADNFAGYIMLQFGKERARKLIAGGAWAWREYVADYRTKPIVHTQLAGFASNHGQPEERFYNLMCLA